MTDEQRKEFITAKAKIEIDRAEARLAVVWTVCRHKPERVQTELF